MVSAEVDRIVSALWALVFQRPDDLSLRLALATALQASGDGRGEFIALQLMPEAERTSAHHRRELMVMAVEGARLGLPGLVGLRRTLAFWMGLPSEVELRLLDGDLDRPELALLRRVVVRGCEGEGGVLGSSTWHRLERLEGVPSVALPHLIRAKAPRLVAVLLGQYPTKAELELAFQLRGLKEFGWMVTRAFAENIVTLSGFDALEQVTLLARSSRQWVRPPAPLLQSLLEQAPLVALRETSDACVVGVEARRDMLTLRCASRTHRFWNWLRPWLRWLEVEVESEWPQVVVELDGRLLVAAEWRRLGRMG